MIDPSIQSSLLESFKDCRTTYEDFASTTRELLTLLLKDAGIQVHSTTYRCKSIESLAKKIAKPEKEYATIDDITDLAAVRITSYFAHDVDLIAKVIEQEFKVDNLNSIDKRSITDPDRFGYQSLHYVVTQVSARNQLPEYRRFRSKKIEIQIRSILQHAWAEIEHDLGYKSAIGLPREVRRRFARIAGLLEVADEEFNNVRDALNKYELEISKQIATHPEQVEIDVLSLKSAYFTSKILQELDNIMFSVATNISLSDGPDFDGLVKRLSHLDIKKISELEEIASTNLQIIKEFSSRWFSQGQQEVIAKGSGIACLCNVLIASNDNINLIVAHFEHLNIGSVKRSPETDSVICFHQLHK